MGGTLQPAHPLPPSEYLLGGDEYFEEGFISGIKRPLGLGSFLTPPGSPEWGSPGPAPLAVGRGRAFCIVGTCSQAMALGHISEHTQMPTGCGYVGGRQIDGRLSGLHCQDELPKARL